MGVKLGKHQLDALKNLSEGKILCGLPGSGKSRVAVAYWYIRHCGGRVKVNEIGGYEPMKKPCDLYVITTARKRDSGDWLTECIDFNVTTDGALNPDGVKVVVDSWNNIGKYVGVKNAFFVLDEQRVVGSGAWVRHFAQIARANAWILLSGTPGDTWLDYVPIFVANGFYRNRTEFIREHVIYKNFRNYPVISRYVGEKKLLRLREKILVDMPLERGTIRHERWVMVDYDREKFDLVMKKRWNYETNEPIKDVAEMFRLMRKVVNSDPRRLEKLVELVEKHPKLIVFYNFNYELEMLRGLESRDLGDISEWNGHKHEEFPSSERWIYLVQYTSGSEAWNCIETNAMLFFSLNYSWKQMEQARGRIDRLNTPFRDLFYYTLRTTAPIDVAILKSLRAKKSFNEAKSELAI